MTCSTGTKYYEKKSTRYLTCGGALFLGKNTHQTKAILLLWVKIESGRSKRIDKARTSYVQLLDIPFRPVVYDLVNKVELWLNYSLIQVILYFCYKLKWRKMYSRYSLKLIFNSKSNLKNQNFTLIQSLYALQTASRLSIGGPWPGSLIGRSPKTFFTGPNFKIFIGILAKNIS